MDTKLIQLSNACNELRAISTLIQSSKVKIDKKGLSTTLSDISDIINETLNVLQAGGNYD